MSEGQLNAEGAEAQRPDDSYRTSYLAVPMTEVASEALVAELRRRGGWRVIADDGKGWVSPAQASLEAGFHKNWLCRILARGEKPAGLEIDRAAGGRVRAVRVSPEFAAWAAVRREPQPSLFDGTNGNHGRKGR